jgi:hypothetical protein
MKMNRKHKGFVEAALYLVIVGLVILFVVGIMLCIKSCAPQSRMKSRLGGKPVVVQLPADCPSLDAIVNVCYDAGEKNVTYISSDGKLRTKTYTDWGIMQGEVVYELSTPAVKAEKTQ